MPFILFTFFSFSVFVFVFGLSGVYCSPVSFQNLFLDWPQPGPIKSVLLVIIGWLVGNPVFSETALRIFLIFCTKLGDYKGRKVTEPHFFKKILIWRYSRKGLQISVGWLVGKAVFSELSLRIFLTFYI